MKATVTSITGYNATMNFVFDDTSTANGVIVNILPLVQLINGTVPAPNAAAQAVMWDAFMYDYGTRHWNGALLAAAAAPSPAAVASALAPILNVQRTVGA